MMSNGQLIGDGSWDLIVHVTSLQTERSIRVKGDLHIGGVMLKLVEDLEISMDWSDHALWWPERNIWLNRTRSTLDQYGVQADAQLYFTPMHKTLRLQLPDLRFINMHVDFSIKTFSAVIQICKSLGIRHPEEISLCTPLEPNHLKYNFKELPRKKIDNTLQKNGQLAPDTNTFIPTHSPSGSNCSLDKTQFLCAPVTPRGPPASTPISSPMGNTGTWKKNGFDANGSYSPNMSMEQLNGGLDNSLAQTPPPPGPDVRKHFLRPKSLVEKARMNVAWLNSSLSIMEQGVREYDTLCLRFKFYDFYDLNPKYDAIRINQIYEQAKWQLLNEEIDCTEEEMLMFAALQLQVNLQANQPQPNYDSNGSIASPQEDDIDAALSDLQTTLEGSNISNHCNDITKVPELNDELKILKPKKILRSYKRYWVSCKDLTLYLYKSREELVHRTGLVQEINLKGCEVTPDVNISQNKYCIKLDVLTEHSQDVYIIRCESESQYAKWMAACRLAAKGRSLADNAKTERAISFTANSLNIQVEDFIAPRYIKKLKGKLIHRILEAHANIKDLSLIEAKLNYIKAWQSLPEYGITLFIIKFVGQKKEDLLGIANSRIMRMDLNTGDHLKTWRYNTMKAWNVNWEVKLMTIQLEDDNKIDFSCLSADCKVIHEFIGGYIFLSMRSKDANQTLNEELFHKLTGGWS
ncbi:fermitin 2-related [Holotrichia oblita]|uniref:Fermitin 2-related n=1 Tax=Holotrichia oblita TaxID=644536 RepID=A0ACB9TQB5_HOLOL|nr:fermitin 2-related [Holotrichia oblita]